MHVRAATPRTSVQTPSVQYSCDFSNYGSGIATATVAVVYQYADSWPVNNPDDIFLVVPADSNSTLSLPTQVSGQLSGVTDFLVQATVQAHNATAATAAVSGRSTDALPDPPTQIPQIIGEGQVTFAAEGTGTVSLPPASFSITPEVITSSGATTAKPAISCTTTTSAQDITITVANASGPFYKCTINFGGGQTATESDSFAMTVTASGNRTVGATDTVTLSSADLAAFLLTDAPSGVTADFSGSLPVQGAQSGGVTLTGSSTTASSLTATGRLVLSQAGTIRLLIPQAFTATLSAQGVSGSIAVSCALQTSPAPAALTLSVARRPGGSGGGGSTEGGGTPAGAPATGGGLGLGSASTPAAAGAGAALIAVGGGLLLWARRRRAGELLAGGLWRGRRRRSS